MTGKINTAQTIRMCTFKITLYRNVQVTHLFYHLTNTGQGLLYFVFLLLAIIVIVKIIHSQIRNQDSLSKSLKTHQGFEYVKVYTN